MKNLNKNQLVAVFVSLGFLTYLLFGDVVINFFNPPMQNTENELSLPEEGFVAEEIALGEGEMAEAGDTLTVHYTGVLTDGQVFDSSVEGEPISFTLGVGQVIRGWDEGVEGMRVGGKRLLVIAPDYAYGDQGVGPIPPSSTLIFEVELLGVEKAEAVPAE
ncbi:MAG: FKBP-type peptidyl-prolyl cis-trans isomerase [Parcubacteria group bacterium]